MTGRDVGYARRFLPFVVPWIAPAVYFLYRWPRHAQITPTDVMYHNLAWNLAQGLGFTYDGVTPVAYVGPAMPYALSLVYKIFGPSIRAAAAFYALLGAATAVLLYRFTVRHFGRREALIAYALYVITPVFWTFYFRIGLETPLILLVLIFVATWTRTEESPTKINLFVTGILCGVTALCKPVFLLLPIFYSAIQFLRKPWTDGARKTLLFSLGMACMVLPWTARNRRALGHFIPVATGSGFALYYGNHLAYDGSNPPPRNDDGDVNRMADVTYPYLLGWETDKKLTPLVWENIKREPAAHAAMWVRKISHFWLGNKYYLLGKDGDLRRSFHEDKAERGAVVAAYSVLKRLMLVPAAILMALYGVWRTRLLWAALWPVFAVAAYLTMVHMIFVVESARYVLPLVPLVYMFVAAGLVDVLDRWRVRRGGRA